ncbi:MAG: YggS family pyridoxal phosphate-dependent enzyme [Nitrospirae bacterium]|nr:YggS family pyridoxal phosphate-dependent enzyme [Nitrospirota bacterium]
MEIAEALRLVQGKIVNSALRAGRNPAEIKIIAVTKTVSIEHIQEAIDAGLRIFGENRVQEAQKKVTSCKLQVASKDKDSLLVTRYSLPKIEWHLIGNLQRNKAKYAVQLFDLIHTIDSIGIAEEVNKQAEKIGKTQRVLVQVKLSKEETKHGVSEEDLMPLLEMISNLRNLKLEGLMTMPPFFDDPEKARLYFRRLRELRDNINKLRVTSYELRDLSMGMSNDFEVAIEEGATMVRVGTAIFGVRR